MTILVCGSREYNGYDYMANFLDDYIKAKGLKKGEDVRIVNGDARGADTLATSYSMQRGYKLSVYPANWKRYGIAAGVIRNKIMLDEAKPDVVVAFPFSRSRGTRHMMRIATEAGVEVINALGGS